MGSLARSLALLTFALAPAAAARTIDQVLPATAPTPGGAVLTLAGSGLDAAIFATVGGRVCPRTAGNAATQLCSLPAGEGAGLDVTAHAANGATLATRGSAFAYTAPSIDDLSPTSGGTAGGVVLTLTGPRRDDDELAGVAARDTWHEGERVQQRRGEEDRARKHRAGDPGWPHRRRSRRRPQRGRGPIHAGPEPQGISFERRPHCTPRRKARRCPRRLPGRSSWTRRRVEAK